MWTFRLLPRCGFTLIETAMVLVIVGVGITASMQLFSTCAAENGVANKVNTAMLLANNIHEASSHLKYCDGSVFGPTAQQISSGPKYFTNTTCFDGASFNPPIDANAVRHPELSQYTQTVRVEAMAGAYNFATTTSVAIVPPAGGYSFPMLRTTAIILYTANGNTSEIYRTSWFRCNE